MKRIIIILLLVWMAFIFYNSAISGVVSNNRSSEIVNTVINGKNIIEGNNIQKSKAVSLNYKFEELNHFLRKNAHAFEYLVLAILVTTLLNSFGLKGNNSIIYIMFICLLYAVLDEFHQSFVPGRTSLVSDVLIDFIGSMIGIIIYSPLVNFTSKLFKKGKYKS